MSTSIILYQLKKCLDTKSITFSLYIQKFIIFLMKNSHDGSAQAFTHPNQQEIQQQSEDYSVKFQKGYKVFQLSSELNEANLQIQKLSIKNQKDKRQSRKVIETITHQRQQIIHKYEYLMTEFAKISTMLQAERQARKKSNAIHKKNREELEAISKALGAKSITANLILEAIQQMKNCQQKRQKTIQTLNAEVEKLITEKNQQLKTLKENNQRQFIRMKQQYQAKLAHAQSQLKQQKLLANNLELVNKKMNEANSKLEKVTLKLSERESQLNEQSKQMLKWKNDCISKQEQLKSLRIKQELWQFSRQKSRQDKSRCDEKIQVIQNQLTLANKKIDVFEQRYQQQKQKSGRLDRLLQQKRDQIRKYEQKYIQLQQQCQSLKKKIYVFEIYKEKYGKTQIKIKQIEERATSFANIAEQYAQQIQNMQQSLSDAQLNISSLQDSVRILKNEIQENKIKLNASQLIVNHQTKLIDEKNSQNIALKSECISLSQKIAQLQVKCSNIKKQSLKPYLCEELINEIKKQVFAHYNKLLEEQLRIRKTLQFEVYQAKMKIVQLKNELSLKQQELAQEKQERRLVEYQKQRLSSTQSENQRHQEKKIVQIRDRYRQIHRVKSENNFKNVSKLKIDFCFSYVLNNETHKIEKTTSNQKQEQRKLMKSYSYRLRQQKNNWRTKYDDIYSFE